jgi:hypothetical protein
MTRNGLIQNADHLKQTSPLIHWPPSLEPRNVDVFVHNEGWIDAPPDIVWGNIIDASQWPSWYSNSADMRIECGQPQLGIGVSFSGKTFGLPSSFHRYSRRPSSRFGRVFRHCHL